MQEKFFILRCPNNSRRDSARSNNPSDTTSRAHVRENRVVSVWRETLLTRGFAAVARKTDTLIVRSWESIRWRPPRFVISANEKSVSLSRADNLGHAPDTNSEHFRISNASRKTFRFHVTACHGSLDSCFILSCPSACRYRK